MDKITEKTDSQNAAVSVAATLSENSNDVSKSDSMDNSNNPFVFNQHQMTDGTPGRIHKINVDFSRDLEASTMRFDQIDAVCLVENQYGKILQQYTYPESNIYINSGGQGRGKQTASFEFNCDQYSASEYQVICKIKITMTAYSSSSFAANCKVTGTYYTVK
jgi:hypothetical protein